MLSGGGPGVSTESGVVTLNLHTLVSQLAATLGLSSQVAAVQSKLQGSTGASARSTAQNKLGITLPPSNGQLVILRSNQLKAAQDIANAVKDLAIVLPGIAFLLFALAIYLARGRRRRTLRTSGWCFVVIGVGAAADPQGRRRRGRQRSGEGSVEQAGRARHMEHRYVAAYNIAVAAIVCGIVVVAAAWLAGSTRPATAIRRFLAPSLRDQPAVAYSVVGVVLLLVVLWGPLPAFRNIWWVLAFAGLLAVGVTMLRRQTAREFPGIERGDALPDYQAQPADVRAGNAVAQPLAVTETTIGTPHGTVPAPAPTMGRVETLERLAALRDSGAITSDEYQAEKKLAMNNGT